MVNGFFVLYEMVLLSSKWLHHCMFSLAMSGWAFLLQILASICCYCEAFATVRYVVFHCWNFKCSRYLCLGALKWHREHSILIQPSPLSSLVTVSLTVIPGKKIFCSPKPLHFLQCAGSLRIPASTVSSKRKTSWMPMVQSFLTFNSWVSFHYTKLSIPCFCDLDVSLPFVSHLLDQIAPVA